MDDKSFQGGRGPITISTRVTRKRTRDLLDDHSPPDLSSKRQKSPPKVKSAEPDLGDPTEVNHEDYHPSRPSRKRKPTAKMAAIKRTSQAKSRSPAASSTTSATSKAANAANARPTKSQPTASSPTKITKPKPATNTLAASERRIKSLWHNPSKTLQSPTDSPLRHAKYPIFRLLLHPKAWSTLKPAQKALLISLFPTAAAAGATPETPDFAKLLDLESNDAFRADYAKWQDSLREGRLTESWLLEAASASQRRARGEFDEVERKGWGRVWGVESSSGEGGSEIGEAGAKDESAKGGEGTGGDREGKGQGHGNGKDGEITEDDVEDEGEDLGQEGEDKEDGDYAEGDD